MEKRKQFDAIFTDLSKAFDSVDHTLVLFKLTDLGMCVSILSWFGSFLTGRTQRVKVSDIISPPFSVHSPL